VTNVPASHPVDVRGYIAVFVALLVLTIVTVGVSYLDLPVTPTILVALAIAATKAALVAMFFMHLKGERPMVQWALGLTGVLFVALFAFLLWSEGDHLFGTRFEDAFGGAGAAVPEQHGEGLVPPKPQGGEGGGH
jgi:cytochrome c oxidase subunit IV